MVLLYESSQIIACLKIPCLDIFSDTFSRIQFKYTKVMDFFAGNWHFFLDVAYPLAEEPGSH